MKDILTYTSYRQYIADYYADKKAKSAFTWQDFADEAGFSSRVYLKYVSEGRFNLSEEATIRVAKAMHLVDYEREFFAEMVKFDNAKTDADKKTHFRKMLSMAEAHKAKILEGDAFRYLKAGSTRSFVNWRLRCPGQNRLRLPMRAVRILPPPR